MVIYGIKQYRWNPNVAVTKALQTRAPFIQSTFFTKREDAVKRVESLLNDVHMGIPGKWHWIGNSCAIANSGVDYKWAFSIVERELIQ